MNATSTPPCPAATASRPSRPNRPVDTHQCSCRIEGWLVHPKSCETILLDQRIQDQAAVDTAKRRGLR